jgi:hypothetical protein
MDRFEAKSNGIVQAEVRPMSKRFFACAVNEGNVAAITPESPSFACFLQQEAQSAAGFAMPA